MQQILLNVASTRKTGYHIKTSVGCGTWTTVCWLCQKMCCIISFKLVCVFRMFYANTATTAKVLVSRT